MGKVSESVWYVSKLHIFSLQQQAQHCNTKGRLCELYVNRLLSLSKVMEELFDCTEHSKAGARKRDN